MLSQFYTKILTISADFLAIECVEEVKHQVLCTHLALFVWLFRKGPLLFTHIVLPTEVLWELFPYEIIQPFNHNWERLTSHLFTA